jgi:hypothetical protein
MRSKLISLYNNKFRFTWLVLLLAAACLLFISPGKAEAALASYITSIEYVEITLGPGTLAASANLTKSQTTANCVPFATSQQNGTDGDFHDLVFDVYFEAGPKVTVARADSAGTVYVGIYVVEFNSTYINVQQGTWTIANSSTSNTSSITAVDQTKAALLSYRKHGGTNDYDDYSVLGYFSADDTITWSRINNWEQIDGHYYVFEAKNSEFAVQSVNVTIAADGTSGTGTISSVTMGKTFVIASYRAGYSSDGGDKGQPSVYLSSSTQITAVRDTSHTTATNVHAYAVTFAGNETVQRGTFTYAASDAQETATLSPSVDTTAAIAWNPVLTLAPGGMETAHSGGNNSGFQRLKIVDSGATVQGDRATTSATASGRWEVIEFTGAALIGHWDFDEGTGTTAADSAGSNDGTLAGTNNGLPAWTCVAGGYALTLDGDDDEVLLSSVAIGDRVRPGRSPPGSKWTPIRPTSGRFTVRVIPRQKSIGLCM